MLRRIILGCLVLLLIGSASGYAQTQTPAPKKIKPVKIKPARIKQVKTSKPPKPANLTPSQKAMQKQIEKNNKIQKQAFQKQNKQQIKALKKAAKQARK